MDMRTALDTGTVLEFSGIEGSLCRCTIERELARGAMSIVYDASYLNNAGVRKSVRLKECYPFRLRLTRAADGSLLAEQQEAAAFQECLARFRAAFDLGNELFGTSGLTNCTTNMLDIYACNETLYVLSAYQEGMTLDAFAPAALKECLMLVRSTAEVIRRIHERGWLYLDIKPENIFVLEGTREIVQLFDFDSLIPADIAERCETEEYRISHTRGFSAVEQQRGDIRHIGRHSDVYGIGALLFALVFGRTPSAMDSLPNAAYDFDASRFNSRSYPDRLFFLMSDFFHHTLADYPLDRYPDMRQASERLTEMIRLADSTAMFLHVPPLYAPPLLLGRADELKQMERWLDDEQSPCLIVSGMGGIGKSTLVRGFLCRHSGDIVLWVQYHHSLTRTICDDAQLKINVLRWDEQEKEKDYFIRKLDAIRSLIHGKRCILVIDDCAYEAAQGLSRLLAVGWRVILITRRNDMADAYAQLRVSAIQDHETLRELFAAYLRQKPQPQETCYVDQIIERCQGHTLALELTARQIVASHLSLAHTAALIAHHGLDALGKEQIRYAKDLDTVSERVETIITGLFDFAGLDEQDRLLMKMRALFDAEQMDIHDFAKLLRLSSFDSINVLQAQGWLSTDADALMIHPLVAQIVRKWPLTKAMRDAAISIMGTLNERLRAEVNAVRKEGMPSGRGDSQALKLGEAFLRSCSQTKTLWECDPCRRLRFACAAHIPRAKEEDILRYALPLIDDHEGLTPEEMLRLCDMCAEIYEEQHDHERAAQVIHTFRQPLLAQRDHHIHAQYCFIISGYYDDLLDGHYQPQDDMERTCLKRMSEAIDLAIRHMRKARRKDSKMLLCEYLRARATLLIRGEPERKLRIRKLLREMNAILKEAAEPWLQCGCALTMAWYHTYVEEDFERTKIYLKKAWKAEQQMAPGDLDLIDDVLRPSANILLEWDEQQACVQLLLDGIQRCERHPGVLPYLRKKLELYGYLHDVCRWYDDEQGVAQISAVMQKEQQKLERQIRSSERL